MKNEFRGWSDLRVFLSVYREGSTLAASRKLGLAQPTVARRIEALEKELGLTLFLRDTRGFRPTADATALLPRAEAVEAASAQFAQEVGNLTGRRPIRITAFNANFSPRVIAIITEYNERHPEIRLDLLPGLRALDLMAGEADIALRLTRTPPDPRLIRRKISTAQFSLHAAPSYAEAHGLPRSERELEGHRFVSFEREDTPNAFDDWLTARVRPEQIVHRFREIDLMHASIRGGSALGFINVRLVKDDPDYVECFPAPPELDIDHVILISPEAHERPEVRSFTKFFAPRYAAIFK